MHKLKVDLHLELLVNASKLRCDGWSYGHLSFGHLEHLSPE